MITPHGSLTNDVDLCYLAQATPGFTGADLSSLVRFAMTKALERWASSDDKVKVSVTLRVLNIMYYWFMYCFLVCIVPFYENLWEQSG